MEVTTEKIDLLSEKRIVGYLATSSEFCDAFLDIDIHLLSQFSYQHIAKLCIDHYKRYGTVIGRNLYNNVLSAFRRNNATDTELQKVHEQILELSNSFKELTDVKPAIDEAYKYLNWCFNQKLELKLKQGDDTTEVEHLLQEMPPPKKVISEIISWTDDSNKLSELLLDTKSGEELFCFEDKLGEVVGTIRRQDFICFSGYYKTGKTYMLVHSAQTAIVNGLNVLFVSLEMSAKEIAERMTAWVTHQPIDDEEVIERPYFLDKQNIKEINYRTYKRKAFQKTAEKLKRNALLKYARLNVTSGKSGLVAIPRGTLSVLHLKKLCIQFRGKYGVKPDVIVIDYADLLKQFKKDDLRASLGDIWEGLRSLAQQEDLAIITASQLNGEERNAKVSDDKRKYAVVTAMIQLFREEGWQEKNCLGIRQEMVRRGKPNKKELILLHNYSCGEVVIQSEWLKNIPELQNKKDKEKTTQLSRQEKFPDIKIQKDGTFGGIKNNFISVDKKIPLETCPYNYSNMTGGYYECNTCRRKSKCREGV